MVCYLIFKYLGIRAFIWQNVKDGPNQIEGIQVKGTQIKGIQIKGIQIEGIQSDEVEEARQGDEKDTEADASGAARRTTGYVIRAIHSPDMISQTVYR